MIAMPELALTSEERAELLHILATGSAKPAPGYEPRPCPTMTREEFEAAARRRLLDTLESTPSYRAAVLERAQEKVDELEHDIARWEDDGGR